MRIVWDELWKMKKFARRLLTTFIFYEANLLMRCLKPAMTN